MTESSKGGGKSPHAFMAEALGVQAQLLEQRRAFLRAALAAEDLALESGHGYLAAAVDAYFAARAAEIEAPAPRLKPWRK